MDELRRNARLVSEILQRASAIQSSLSDTGQRLDTINLVEERHLSKLNSYAQNNTRKSSFQLCTNDILIKIASHLQDVQDLSCLSQVNKRFCELVFRNEDFWKARCISDWNLQGLVSDDVKQLETHFLPKYKGILDKVQQGQLLQYMQSSSTDNFWRDLYQDRYKGFRLVNQVLKWLDAKNHPPDVTGQFHRIQLLLALEYLNLFSGDEYISGVEIRHSETVGAGVDQAKEVKTCKGAWYEQAGTSQMVGLGQTAIRENFVQQSTIQSMLALLENACVHVVELALQVLFNISNINYSLYQYLIEQSSNGRSLVGLLNSKDENVVQKTVQLLIRLWLTNDFVCGRQREKLRFSEIIGNTLQVQEYSSRGDLLRKRRLILQYKQLKSSELAIKKQDSWSVVGDGYVMPDFREQSCVEGRIDGSSNTIYLSIKDMEMDQIVNLRGWIGNCHIYGVYQYQRIKGAGQQFVISQEMQPRVFVIKVLF